MLDRRHFLVSTAALGAAAASSGVALAAAKPSTSDPAEAAKLNALMDKVFNAQLDESPENTTSLGVDTGARASARSKLDDRSAEAIRHRLPGPRSARQAGDEHERRSLVAVADRLDRADLDRLRAFRRRARGERGPC